MNGDLFRHRKRNEDEGESSKSRKRRRRSGDGTINYLRDKMEMDIIYNIYYIYIIKERELQIVK